MTGLRVAPRFTLPLDVAGEAIGLLATRGAGKSYTSAVIVEELFTAGVQTVVLDPTGVYWGLRGSGEKDGLPIYVFGGQHGDLPLEATAGALLADLAVDEEQSFVLDLSGFDTKAEQTRFVTAFAERLYRRKAQNRQTLVLVVDEADEFAPQRPMRDEPRMLGAMEAIVRRGRSRGLGCILITQRSAALNKNVLDLVETLFIMRTLGPRDRKAVEGWIAVHEAADELGVLDSLPSLPTGTAWVWSPVRGILEKIAVRRIRTFDSYRTPKPGEARPEPKELAPIDLGDLGEKMAATVERAKENDPAELKREIAALRRQLVSAKRHEVPVEVNRVVEKIVEVPIEVPALDPESLQLLQSIVHELRDVAEAASALRAVADQIEEGLRHVREAAVRRDLGRDRESARPHREPAERPAHRARHRPEDRQAGPATAFAQPHPDTGEVHLKAGARRILETLARHHPMLMTKAQLGTLAKFKITGGTFQTYWSTLKRLGYVSEEGREIAITDAGLDYVGHVPAEPQTTEEILDMWRSSLKAGARQMLDELVEAYPDWLGREELAERVGMTASGGTFQTYLGTLRRNGLADVESGEVRASDTLFIGATA